MVFQGTYTDCTLCWYNGIPLASLSEYQYTVTHNNIICMVQYLYTLENQSTMFKHALCVYLMYECTVHDVHQIYNYMVECCEVASQFL